MGLGVELDPIEEVPALLAVLEEHQAGNAERRNQILDHHVHREAEHHAVQEASEDVRDHGHGEDREQVLGLQAQESDSRPQVSLHGSDFKRHLRILRSVSNLSSSIALTIYVTPPTPWVTKYSARRRRPETSRHKPAARKCR